MRPFAIPVLIALCLPNAAGAITYTTFTHSSFVGVLPGPDGLIGTVDDVASAGANPAGTAAFVQFSNVSPVAGTNFFSFQDGTFTINEPLVAIGGQVAIDDFSVSLSNSQTNGFSSTSVDLPSLLPHDVVYNFPGTVQANYTLLTTSAFGTLEADVSLAGFTIVPGVDPFLLPGISPTVAGYFNTLIALATPTWTSISVSFGLPTTIDTTNTRGSLAPFFIGGTANGVSVLVTSDPLNIMVPEPSAVVLLVVCVGQFARRWSSRN